MAVGRFFFTAAPTAQNSPELHFPFINSFIQPSLLESLQRNEPHKLKAKEHQFSNIHQEQHNSTLTQNKKVNLVT